MGLFSKSEDEMVNLDELDQAAFEKPFSKARPAMQGPVPDYGVDKAIELINGLPQNDLDSAIEVVMHTLESMGIDVGAIINDAEQKEYRLAERIDFLKREIETISSQISKHGEEIGQYSGELEEILAIRKLLEVNDVAPSAKQKASAKAAKPLQIDDSDGTMDSVALIGEETEA